MSFHGTPAAAFHRLSTTRATAVVAAGTTSGPIGIVTPSAVGTISTVASFTVLGAPSAVAVALASPPSGCVRVGFDLAQAQSAPVDVALEVAVDGGPYRPATTASELGGDGALGLGTSPTGAGHIIIWDSARDVPRDASVALRVRTALRGRPGAAGELAAVALANGLHLGAPSAQPDVAVHQATLADLDGDGWLDLVDLASPTVAVSLGQPDGGFAAPLTTSVAAFVASRPPRVGDVDEDGFPDVVYFADGATSASVLLGRGDGSWPRRSPWRPPRARRRSPIWRWATSIATATSTWSRSTATPRPATCASCSAAATAPSPPRASTIRTGAAGPAERIALADLDGDRDLDALVTTTSGKVALFARSDLGVLARVPRAAVGAELDDATGVLSALALDADRDGRLDLALGLAAGVVVYHHAADGTFAAGPEVALSGPVSALAAADLDGDQAPELVAVAAATNVAVLANDGAGAFDVSATSAGSAALLALGDLDRDGRRDLVSAAAGALVTLPNATPRSCRPGLEAARRIDARSARALVVADLDGDGRPDVVTAHLDDASLSVALGQGDGSAAAPARVPTGDAPVALALGDLSGDGVPDLAVATDIDAVAVLLGQGDGSFAPFAAYPTDAAPSDVAIGDVDGDGRPDLLVANAGADDVSLLLGLGDGTFAPARQFPAGDAPLSVALGDLDGDGALDALVASRAASQLAVLRGSADGRLDVPATIALLDALDGLLLGDADGDGRLDALVTHAASTSLDLLRGLGDASFATAPAVPLGARPDRVALGDVDGDALADVVVASGSDDVVTLVRGDGLGGWSTPATLVAGGGPSAVALADLDLDGHVDVLAARDAGGIAVVHGGAAGFRQASAQSDVALAPRALAVGDFDGDGRPDLALARSGDHDVVVLVGSPRVARTVSTGRVPVALAAADLDHDGRDDLVVETATTPLSPCCSAPAAPSPPTTTSSAPRRRRWRWAISIAAAASTWWSPATAPRPSPCSSATRKVLSHRWSRRRPSRASSPSRWPTSIATAAPTPSTSAPPRPRSPSAPASPPAASARAAPTRPASRRARWRWPTSTPTARPTWPWPTFSDVVSLRLGQGDGSFGPALELAVGGAPSALAAGDVDGDARSTWSWPTTPTTA
ncbi:MAG: VCBS repeat-containing protein [Myxococcota bacterium]